MAYTAVAIEACKLSTALEKDHGGHHTREFLTERNGLFPVLSVGTVGSHQPWLWARFPSSAAAF